MTDSGFGASVQLFVFLYRRTEFSHVTTVLALLEPSVQMVWECESVCVACWVFFLKQV